MGGIIWGLVLVGIIAVIVALLLSRGQFRRLGINESLMPIAVSVTQRIRLRNLVSVGAAGAVAILTIGYGASIPNDFGRPLFFAPILTAATGIVFFSIVPAFRESSPQRSADLAPRTALTFGRVRWFVRAGVLAVVQVATSIGLGLASDGGRRLTRVSETYALSSGPFPGFFYSWPALAALALLAGVVVLAIVRIARAPQPGEESLREADRTLRQLAVGVVLRAASTGIAATIAALLIPAGTISATLGHGVNFSGDMAVPDDAVLLAFAAAELITGAVFAVLAIVLAVWTITSALRKPLEIALEPVAA